MTANAAVKNQKFKMNKWAVRLFALLILHFAFTSLPAWAYEEGMVTDGGTVMGTVTLDGSVPKPKGYNLVTLPDQYYCGRISDGRGWRILQPFQVGPSGEFRDAVVYGAKAAVEAHIVIPAPMGRLYANKVLDHPYVRYNASEEMQREIDPMVEKRER